MLKLNKKNFSKKKMFLLCNRIYEKFFKEINFFFSSMFDFYIFFFSYLNVILISLNKLTFLDALISLSLKKINFFSCNVYNFYQFCSPNLFCFLENKDIKSRFLKKNFFLKIDTSNIQLDNLSFVFIKKYLNSFIKKKIKKKRKKTKKAISKEDLLNSILIPNFKIKLKKKKKKKKKNKYLLFHLKDICSFLFFNFFIKIRRSFIKVFSNFMSELFNLNFLNFFRHNYYYNFSKYWECFFSYMEVELLLPFPEYPFLFNYMINVNDLVYKRYLNLGNYYWISFYHSSYYNIYNVINTNNFEIRKYYNFLYLFNFSIHFFDLFEFVSNRWERHLFIDHGSIFFLYFLSNYRKNTLFFMFTIILILYLWSFCSDYFGRVWWEQWKKYGPYKGHVYAYYYSYTHPLLKHPYHYMYNEFERYLTGHHVHSLHLLK